MGKLIASGALSATLALNLIAAPALAEPARTEPLQSLGGFHQRAPKTLRTFTVNGQQLSVVAYGRDARADTQHRRDLVDEAKAMDKVIPGYPQPPIMTVDFKLWF